MTNCTPCLRSRCACNDKLAALNLLLRASSSPWARPCAPRRALATGHWPMHNNLLPPAPCGLANTHHKHQINPQPSHARLALVFSFNLEHHQNNAPAHASHTTQLRARPSRRHSQQHPPAVAAAAGWPAGWLAGRLAGVPSSVTAAVEACLLHTRAPHAPLDPLPLFSCRDQQGISLCLVRHHRRLNRKWLAQWASWSGPPRPWRSRQRWR